MYRLNLGYDLIGITKSSARAGEKVDVIMSEFSSSEDGDLFINRLDEVSNIILNRIVAEQKIKCSMIDHLLVVLHKGGVCDVYINELQIIALIKPTREIHNNDVVYESDFAEIYDLKFNGVDIANDCGVIVILSHGWRKGLFFDLMPLAHDNKPREYNISSVLANCYGYLYFQDLYKISESVWNELFSQQWFPFIGLSKNVVQALVSKANDKWSCDEILADVSRNVRETIESKTKDWETSGVFGEHMFFISRAIERFLNGDYISATSILYTRIEGILRSFNCLIGNESNRQKDLSKAPLVMSKIPEHKYSRLLPDKFVKYLEEVYFASFTPNQPSNISRNSVGHGVANAEVFSEKSAVIGILIIEQLFFHKPIDINLIDMNQKPTNT